MKDKIINNNQPDQDLKKSEDDLNLKNLKYFSTISLSKPKETEGKLVFLLLSGDPDVVDDNLKGELKKQKPFSLASLTRILLLLAKVKKFKNIIVIGGTTLQRFNIAINEEKAYNKTLQMEQKYVERIEKINKKCGDIIKYIPWDRLVRKEHAVNGYTEEHLKQRQEYEKTLKEEEEKKNDVLKKNNIDSTENEALKNTEWTHFEKMLKASKSYLVEERIALKFLGKDSLIADYELNKKNDCNNGKIRFCDVPYAVYVTHPTPILIKTLQSIDEQRNKFGTDPLKWLCLRITHHENSEKIIASKFKIESLSTVLKHGEKELSKYIKKKLSGFELNVYDICPDLLDKKGTTYEHDYEEFCSRVEAYVKNKHLQHQNVVKIEAANKLLSAKKNRMPLQEKKLPDENNNMMVEYADISIANEFTVFSPLIKNSASVTIDKNKLSFGCISMFKTVYEKTIACFWAGNAPRAQ